MKLLTSERCLCGKTFGLYYEDFPGARTQAREQLTCKVQDHFKRDCEWRESLLSYKKQ